MSSQTWVCSGLCFFKAFRDFFFLKHCIKVEFLLDTFPVCFFESCCNWQNYQEHVVYVNRKRCNVLSVTQSVTEFHYFEVACSKSLLHFSIQNEVKLIDLRWWECLRAVCGCGYQFLDSNMSLLCHFSSAFLTLSWCCTLKLIKAS